MGTIGGCLIGSGTIGDACGGTATQVGGNAWDTNPETRRYWESERARLRALRDDDDVMVML